MSLSAGDRIGPYEIIGLLGAGGMGEVYRGRDARLARDVAVKVLPPNLAADAETGNIYAHGVQGLFICFNPDGKVLWQKSLTEEYGRVTGYGGRVGSPIVDEDLVIIHMLHASWGDQERGGKAQGRGNH